MDYAFYLLVLVFFAPMALLVAGNVLAWRGRSSDLPAFAGIAAPAAGAVPMADIVRFRAAAIAANEEELRRAA